MGESTSLKEILSTLTKRILLIMIVTAAATAAGGLISFFALTPIYENSTQILVNQSKNERKEVQFNDVQTNLQLINTYNVIIKSPAILDEVIKEMGLSMTSQELNDKITVSSEQDSQVVNISVRDENAETAAHIANTIASVFQDKITSIMNVDNVSILSKAEVSEHPSPVSPKPLLNIAIAFAAGLAGSIGLAFLLEHLDNTIKSDEQLESLLDIPALGTVSTIAVSNLKKRGVDILALRKNRGSRMRRNVIAMTEPKSLNSEQYRTIRTNIEFASVDRQMKSVMITSACPGEGKSTTAANLAVVFAQQGKKVLLIDADLRKPTVHTAFFLENTVGLTSVLLKKSSMEQAVQASNEKHLDVLTSGPIPPNPAELLSSKWMKELAYEACAAYDMVIFDTPPILAVADAQILGNVADGSVLVISSGKTEKEQAAKAKEALETCKSKLLGAIMNGKKLSKHSEYGYYGNKDNFMQNK